jgi:non-heme chloroperoxidase
VNILDQHNRTVISADGTRLEAFSWGNPEHPALVLVPGGMQSGLSFSEQVESLAQEYFLVTFDLRGHFRSEKPRAQDAYILSKWADDLHAVITAFGLQRPVACGWSLGGCVIYSYLHYYQPELSGIIFVASPIDLAQALPVIGRDPAVLKVLTDVTSTDEETRRVAGEQFVDLLFANPVSPGKYAETLGYNLAAPPQAVASMIAGMSQGFGEPIGPFLQRLSLPILLIQGGKDPICSAELAVALARETGIPLELFADSGHSTFYEEPERWRAVVTAFLARVYGARPV